MFEIEIDIKPEELQQEYQHVHHARALEYWEQARHEFLTWLGFPSEQYKQRGLFWVIASIKADYKREVRSGRIRVTCENGRIEGKALVLDQRIYNERGKLAVEGQAVGMLLSRESGRSAPIPEEFVRALQAKSLI